MDETTPLEPNESELAEQGSEMENQLRDLNSMVELYETKSKAEVAPFLLSFKEQHFDIHKLEELGIQF
jgi:hypothetical protein